MPDLTLIICSHNPRRDYLERTMEGLRRQTLPLERWELLLIDNASTEPIHNWLDLSWHLQARFIQESEPGLTQARLSGMAEARGDLLVFVDDDNVLTSDYLTEALTIFTQHPYVGAWCGSVAGEYEAPLPRSLTDWSQLIAVRECDRDQWGHIYGLLSITPFGAGMCLRKSVTQKYADTCAASSDGKILDRCGTSLSSGGDLDMAYTALDLGLAIGRFKALRMTHLIPKERTTVDYFSRLAFSGSESSVYLFAKRPQTRHLNKRPTLKSLFLHLLFALPRGLARLRVIHASWSGTRKGFQMLDSQKASS